MSTDDVRISLVDIALLNSGQTTCTSAILNILNNRWADNSKYCVLI